MKHSKDPSNGYLVNGKCIFGVDVYVIKNQGIGECVSLFNGTKIFFSYFIQLGLAIIYAMSRN